MPLSARLRARRRSRRRDRALLAAARALERHGLVVGTVGNVSVRDGERIRITPTATPYEQLRPRDLVTVDGAGRRWGGGPRPSRELPLHVEVYAARPDVGAVVHAHGVYAQAWSFLGQPLAPAIEEADYYDIGPVAVSASAPAGSDALARAVAAALGGSEAVLVAGHGLVAVGPDPARALLVARVVEHHAHVAWLLRSERRGANPELVSDILLHGQRRLAAAGGENGQAGPHRVMWNTVNTHTPPMGPHDARAAQRGGEADG